MKSPSFVFLFLALFVGGASAATCILESAFDYTECVIRFCPDADDICTGQSGDGDKCEDVQELCDIITDECCPECGDELADLIACVTFQECDFPTCGDTSLPPVHPPTTAPAPDTPVDADNTNLWDVVAWLAELGQLMSDQCRGLDVSSPDRMEELCDAFFGHGSDRRILTKATPIERHGVRSESDKAHVSSFGTFMLDFKHGVEHESYSEIKNVLEGNKHHSLHGRALGTNDDLSLWETLEWLAEIGELLNDMCRGFEETDILDDLCGVFFFGPPGFGF
jgi:hypothetical protein